MIIPVILAGGNGTRLWPVSRQSYPKQFTQLIGDRSLFQQTVLRLRGRSFEAPFIITTEENRFIALEQLEQIEVEDFTLVIEPEGRNTAPAVLTAALAHHDQPEAIMLVAPSDHMIGNPVKLAQSLALGAQAAKVGSVVTFGVTPTRAATGFGYLKLAGGEKKGLYDVSGFVEKPSADRATDMVADGGHMWNAGMFMFRVDTVLKAFEDHAPDLMDPCRAALGLSTQELGFRRLDPVSFAKCPKVAFDTAVMEKLGNCRAVPLDCDWADLGSWRALRDVQDQDEAGNAVLGNSRAIECSNSLLQSTNPDIAMVGLGLDNIVAVATDDGVLVADAAHSGAVGKVVDVLRAQEAPQADGFCRCYRPWGYYETLSLGDRFQVKRIMVKPGAKLSLQSHVHRSEHWVVVSGSAVVTVGDDISLLSENESTYIPLGAVHRLENPGKLPLHLIEVQSGCYLGEDDIVRYEDIYARDAQDQVA